MLFRPEPTRVQSDSRSQSEAKEEVKASNHEINDSNSKLPYTSNQREKKIVKSQKTTTDPKYPVSSQNNSTSIKYPREEIDAQRNDSSIIVYPEQEIEQEPNQYPSDAKYPGEKVTNNDNLSDIVYPEDDIEEEPNQYPSNVKYPEHQSYEPCTKPPTDAKSISLL